MKKLLRVSHSSFRIMGFYIVPSSKQAYFIKKILHKYPVKQRRNISIDVFDYDPKFKPKGLVDLT